jgi:hypothetical protein
MAARAKKLVWFGAAAALLLAVFALYARPDVMVMMGDLLWACFN